MEASISPRNFPITLQTATVLACLPFGPPADRSEWRLLDSGQVVLFPGSQLRHLIETATPATDTQVLKWSVSLLYGLAAVGAACYVKGWRPAAFLCFGLSGLTGVLGSRTRAGLQEWREHYDRPLPLQRLNLMTTPDGGLRIEVLPRNGNIAALPAFSPGSVALELAPEDFDPADGEIFCQAVAIERERLGL